MEIPKDKIIEFLRERGQDDKAGQAEQELPDTVDHERDAGLLEKYGIDPQELAGKLPGGVGDKLGL
jgi:hypothetical protein